MAYDAHRTAHAIEAGHDAIREAVGQLVEDLYETGALRVHRAWGAHSELEQIKEAATRVAVASVLTTDWSVLDDETRWLWLERDAQQPKPEAA